MRYVYTIPISEWPKPDTIHKSQIIEPSPKHCKGCQCTKDDDK